MLQINQPLHKLSIKLVVPFLFCMPYLYQILMVISIYIRHYDGKKLAVSLKLHANGATYHQPLHKLPIKLVVPFLFCMPYLYQSLMVISIYIRHYDGKKIGCVPKMACERRHLNESMTPPHRKSTAVNTVNSSSILTHHAGFLLTTYSVNIDKHCHLLE